MNSYTFKQILYGRSDTEIGKVECSHKMTLSSIHNVPGE
jgi:hypothetical protein